MSKMTKTERLTLIPAAWLFLAAAVFSIIFMQPFTFIATGTFAAGLFHLIKTL